MNKMIKIVFMVVLLASLVLAAGCNLKASTAPTAKVTPTSELDFLTPTAGKNIAGEFATQTAAADKKVATATPAAPKADEATATPEAPKPTDAAQPTATTAANQAAATSTPVPAVIPTLTRPATYTIQKGEFPYCIARRYDLDVASFFAANGLGAGSVVSVGAVLKIPASGNWNTAAYGPRALHKHADYKVNSGDTVYTIACYFGDVSPEAILAANGLAKASDVKAGMTLKIP